MHILHQEGSTLETRAGLALPAKSIHATFVLIIHQSKCSQPAISHCRDGRDLINSLSVPGHALPCEVHGDQERYTHERCLQQLAQQCLPNCLFACHTNFNHHY